MAAQPNYYEILQVSPDATTEVIEAAYRALQKRYHPDAGGNERIAKLLNEAREILCDPVRRAAYDREHAHRRSAEPPFEVERLRGSAGGRFAWRPVLLAVGVAVLLLVLMRPGLLRIFVRAIPMH